MQRWRMNSTGLSPHTEGEWVRYQDAHQRDDLLAATKEVRDALAALMRVIHGQPDEAAFVGEWQRELERIGIAPGFGVRADAAIAKTEGR